MASATGEAVADLHGPRLRTLLERLVDTPVRGVVYEAAGTVEGPVLAAGTQAVRDAERTWRMPAEIADTDPADREAWLAAMTAAVRQAARSDQLDLRAMADYAKDVLVETQWVEEHLDDRLASASSRSTRTPRLYAEAHIPGAVGFDWHADLQDPVRRDFVGPAELRRAVRQRGISNDTRSCSTATATTGAPPTATGCSYYGHTRRGS